MIIYSMYVSQLCGDFINVVLRNCELVIRTVFKPIRKHKVFLAVLNVLYFLLGYLHNMYIYY